MSRRATPIDEEDFNKVVALICRLLELDPAKIKIHSHRQEVKRWIRKRWILFYLLNTTFGIPHRQSGLRLGFKHTHLFRCCYEVEDWRDDPVFNNKLRNIEKILKESGLRPIRW